MSECNECIKESIIIVYVYPVSMCLLSMTFPKKWCLKIGASFCSSDIDPNYSSIFGATSYPESFLE